MTSVNSQSFNPMQYTSIETTENTSDEYLDETETIDEIVTKGCLLYTSPSPRDRS